MNILDFIPLHSVSCLKYMKDRLIPAQNQMEIFLLRICCTGSPYFRFLSPGPSIVQNHRDGVDTVPLMVLDNRWDLGLEGKMAGYSDITPDTEMHPRCVACLARWQFLKVICLLTWIKTMWS